MKTRLNKPFALALTLILCRGATIPSQAEYNPFILDGPSSGHRARRGEFYLLGQYFNIDATVIPNVTLPTTPPPNPVFTTGDLSFDMEDSGFWGLGFAYHINNHFAVRGEFSSGYPDYAASFNGDRLSGEAFVNEGRFNLDYHILPGPFTPYVSAGLGYFYVDTGIPSGPPGYTIWWDYWWGYTVLVSQPTYTETFFTLNAAAGLRWDINDDFFLKAEAGCEWIKVDNGADWLQSLRGTVSIGWKF